MIHPLVQAPHYQKFKLPEFFNTAIVTGALVRILKTKCNLLLLYLSKRCSKRFSDLSTVLSYLLRVFKVIVIGVSPKHPYFMKHANLTFY